jgi:hypothetical protein
LWLVVNGFLNFQKNIKFCLRSCYHIFDQNGLNKASMPETPRNGMYFGFTAFDNLLYENLILSHLLLHKIYLLPPLSCREPISSHHLQYKNLPFPPNPIQTHYFFTSRCTKPIPFPPLTTIWYAKPATSHHLPFKPIPFPPPPV